MSGGIRPRLVHGYVGDFMLKFCFQLALRTGGPLNDHQLLDAVEATASRLGIDLGDPVIYDQFTFGDMLLERQRRYLEANGLTTDDMEAARHGLVAAFDEGLSAEAAAAAKPTPEIS